METQGKYRIMAFKEFVPDKIRFIVLLVTAIIFQLSNSVYLTNLNEISNDRLLSSEDIKLIASASFIGMTIIFPLLFRIKFRFTSRTILLTSCMVVILGNIISMYTDNLLILILVSFCVGAFRMIGTFECMSSIQLIITPKRDFTVFFSVIYLMVLGSIQFSGLLTAEISYAFNWKYMYILIVTLQLIVMATLFVLLRSVRFMKKLPLYQVDWLGMFLWSALLLVLNFIFEHGKKLDWFASDYIRIAVVVSIVLLIVALQRMFGIRRPYIMPEIFRYKFFVRALLMFAVLQIFLSTSNVILNVYTGAVLHYDILHNTSLNWIVFVGVVIGAAFGFYWMSLYRGNYKTIFFIGFLCFTLHHLLFYFIFQTDVAKEDLYLPYLLKGIGYIVLYISLSLYAAEGVPFPHFFASLSMLGFVRTAVGGTMANSLCSNILQYLQKRNVMTLSQQMDTVNGTSAHVFQSTIENSINSGLATEQANVMATGTLQGLTNMHAMLLSWKEIFGAITLLGIIVLLAIAFTKYIKPTLINN